MASTSKSSLRCYQWSCCCSCSDVFVSAVSGRPSHPAVSGHTDSVPHHSNASFASHELKLTELHWSFMVRCRHMSLKMLNEIDNYIFFILPQTEKLNKGLHKQCYNCHQVNTQQICKAKTKFAPLRNARRCTRAWCRWLMMSEMVRERGRNDKSRNFTQHISFNVNYAITWTRSSAIAEGPRDVPCQLKQC